MLSQHAAVALGWQVEVRGCTCDQAVHTVRQQLHCGGSWHARLVVVPQQVACNTPMLRTAAQPELAKMGGPVCMLLCTFHTMHQNVTTVCSVAFTPVPVGASCSQ